jgi:hypothetical protein
MVTSSPADGTVTPSCSAIVGISPTITNSVVPIAKALMVNASNARGIFFTPNSVQVDGDYYRPVLK